MPELPEVALFRRVAAGCVGRVIARATIHDPDSIAGPSPATVKRRLKGAGIRGAARHGKHLLLDLDAAGCLAMHFGMNGSLARVAAEALDPPYTRLGLVLDGGERLDYLNPRRLGKVELAKDAATFIAAAGLGPDALDPRFDRPALAAIVAGRKRDIKSILMDQALVAGIGNLYSDEILFQARIHPQHRGDTLDGPQIGQLHGSIGRVLKAAIAWGAGSEQNLDRLPNDFLLRERRRDGHCPRCGAALATLKHGGRTAYYCPRCQPEP